MVPSASSIGNPLPLLKTELERVFMIERWRATEKEICRLLGKKHIGGPGQPDCSGGGEVVEVKAQRIG